jgi:hypothetical protein
MRNSECRMRSEGADTRREIAASIPHSEFRIPHLP